MLREYILIYGELLEEEKRLVLIDGRHCIASKDYNEIVLLNQTPSWEEADDIYLTYGIFEERD
jgi:hypothetical protein